MLISLLLFYSLPLPEAGPTSVFKTADYKRRAASSVWTPRGCALTQPGFVYTGFEVVTAMNVKITGFWDVTPCGVVHR
jgi:hypothetical protein